MNARLQLLQGKIDALTLRERLLVMVSAIAVIVMFWHLLFNSVALTKIQLLRDQIATEQEKLQSKRQETQFFVRLMETNPNEVKREELQILQRQLEQQNSRIEQLSSPLVAPDKLALLLEHVLRQKSRLELIAIETQEPGLITLDNNLEELAKGGVYRHTVKLHLRGQYLDTLAYLRALETLDWNFYWQSLDYKVDVYPTADIFLEVYTISTGEGLFGV